MRRAIAGIALGIAAMTSIVSAQDTSRVAPGDHVRVLAPLLGRYDWKGEFVAVRADSVVLRGRGSDSALTVMPIGKISRFEVNHGNRPVQSMALRGLAGGAIVGLGIGLIAASYYSCDHECTTSKGEVALVSTASFAALGLGIGALIRHEPYERVWLKPQVSVVALPGGRLGLGLSLSP